jgi:predicted nucleotidyltransferase component of viral defense system
VLNPAEEHTVAEQFGVARSQVRRDHLISHLLAALSAHCADHVVFFGGTALSRSFVPDGQLSEDIDLIAVGRRQDVAGPVERCLVRGTRREYPGLRWQPALSMVHDAEPATLTSDDGVIVQIQLLGPTGYPPWPTESRDLVQRYSDAPPARLTIPTVASFAAWKTDAWMDRAASRDLFDLWSLARIGALNAEAAKLFARYGPTNRPPAGHLFLSAPAEAKWRRDLAEQTRLQVTAADALASVREAWGAVS